MDRRWPLAAFLLTGLIAAASLAATPQVEIREARWLAADRRLDALSSQPAECALLPSDRDERGLFAIGRSLFSNPLLLGGQAARAGLSCASCHRNGRGNPDFIFPGLSGAAGTADVTSSLMSKSRGDGVFNPVHIPDLALDTPKISRAPGDPALAQFIRGLVVEEFDGREPPARAIEGLAAYVRAISVGACKGDKAKPLTLGADLGEIVLTLGSAQDEARRGEGASARLVLSGARDRLGLIAARYAGHPRELKSLAKADQAIVRLQKQVDTDPKRAAAKWRAAETRLASAQLLLTQSEAKSLYPRDRLAAWLGVMPIPLR